MLAAVSFYISPTGPYGCATFDLSVSFEEKRKKIKRYKKKSFFDARQSSVAVLLSSGAATLNQPVPQELRQFSLHTCVQVATSHQASSRRAGRRRSHEGENKICISRSDQGDDVCQRAFFFFFKSQFELFFVLVLFSVLCTFIWYCQK